MSLKEFTMTKHILLIDDNDQIRDRLTQMLTKEGYNVCAAINGLDGYNKLQGQYYDLCIIDHLMPLMDGVQLLKNIESMRDNVPKSIMFLTTEPLKSVTQMPPVHIVDVVMSKPLNMNEFTQNVSQLFEQVAEVA